MGLRNGHVASCFEAIPHDQLMLAIEERVCDRKLLRLLRGMLGTGVIQQGAITRRTAGCSSKRGDFTCLV